MTVSKWLMDMDTQSQEAKCSIIVPFSWRAFALVGRTPVIPARVCSMGTRKRDSGGRVGTEVERLESAKIRPLS